MSCRRAGYANMHFLSSRLANHLNDLLRSGAADDRIVHKDHPLPVDEIFYRIEFQTNAERADRLRRFDESAIRALL